MAADEYADERSLVFEPPVVDTVVQPEIEYPLRVSAAVESFSVAVLPKTNV